MPSTMDYEVARVEPDAALEFTERLADLGVEQWLMVASATNGDGAARSQALAFIEALVNHYGLRVAAWSVLDGVATCAYVSTDHTLRRATTRRLSARLLSARNAANAAALALLLRPLLHPADFDVLYRPFATVAPL